MRKVIIGLFVFSNFLFATSETVMNIKTTAKILKRDNMKINHSYQNNKMRFTINNLDEKSIIYLKELGLKKKSGNVSKKNGEKVFVSFISKPLGDKRIKGEIKVSKNMKGYLTLRTIYN